MPRILAIDCDLNRIHGWHSVNGMVCTNTSDIQPVYQAASDSDIMLFEIASPVHYRDGAGAAYNLMRWALWNMHIATRLHDIIPATTQMLVSPSSAWTKGLDVKVRHGLCAAKGRNKDLRECESMIWFYSHHPDDWTTLRRYVSNL